MNVGYARTFNKQFKKLPRKRQQHIRSAVKLFLQNTTNPSLRNHALKGEWLGHRSISAGGDLRLHFKVIDNNTVLFIALGTHSELYR